MEQAMTFPAAGNMLEGLLWQPPAPATRGVVICHPHPLRGGEMHNPVVAAVAEAVQARGIATLRFNFRGVGDSTGTHADGQGEIEDVRAAVTCLMERTSLASVDVAGYSFGAMVGLAVGSSDPRVARLVGIAPPIKTRDMAFLRQVTKPMLLIAGEYDDYCPLPQLRDLAPATTQIGVVVGGDHFFRGIEYDVGGRTADFLAV